MSWSVEDSGPFREVQPRLKAALSHRCVEPEETVKNKFSEMLDVLAEKAPDLRVRVRAFGSQGSVHDAAGNITEVTDTTLSIDIQQIRTA